MRFCLFTMRRWISLAALIVLALIEVTAVTNARADNAVSLGAGLEVVSVDALKHVERRGQLTPKEAQSRTYVLKTVAHAPLGEAYVILTDRDAAWERDLQRLADHHGGAIVRVEDLARLPKDQALRQQLRAHLAAVRPRYVAIAPRPTSYRENVLLALWDVLSTLDDDAQLDVFPGLLLAADEASLSSLVDRSIRYQPRATKDLRPYIVGQVTDENSIMGQRSLQKVKVLERDFINSGITASSLITHTYRAPSPDNGAAEVRQWSIFPTGPRPLIGALPMPAKQALDESSLLLLFGHGVPGVACSLDVKLFREVRMSDKVVLCGSCFSAAPLESDFPGPRGQRGPAMIKRGEPFVQCAIGGGAVTFYGHMRENSGFPQLYPVLDAWMHGLTIGEGYQQMMNAVIKFTDLKADDFVLAEADAGNERAVMQRNELLYVVVGDPALRLFAPSSASN